MFRLIRNERGFIHKRLLSAAGGFLSGGPIGAARGFISLPDARPATVGASLHTGGVGGLPCPTGFENRGSGCVPSGFTSTQAIDRQVCEPPLVQDPRGRGVCVYPGSPSAGGATFQGGGSQPSTYSQTVSRCERGWVLGGDGMCYPKGMISNRNRKWPRGRRPLLTGGEMRAINTASAAARKIQRKVKQLQGMGMLKRPAARRRGTTAAAIHHSHHGD